MRSIAFVAFVAFAATVVAAVACSPEERTFGDASDGGTDAGITSDAGTDSAPATDGATGTCNPTMPFQTAEKLGPTINTDAPEYAGRLSSDGRSLVFQRSVTEPGRGFEIFAAPRLGDDFAFGTAVAIDAINGVYSDGTPSLGPNGELIWEVERLPTGSTGVDVGNFDIWSAARADGGFAAPQVLTSVSTTDTERTPYLVGDGHALFFSRKVGSALAKIMVSYRSGQTFGPATIVPGLDNDSLEVGDAVVTNNELVVYFKREQAATQKSDIYRASRNAAIEPFGTADPLVELNTTGNDSPTWISDDECTILLARSPDGVTADLYVARRPR